MTAGKLAAVRPAATTNTLLYRCPIDRAASTVLNVVNTTTNNITYRLGIRDYDQVLTLNAATYKFEYGNVVSAYKLTVTPGVTASSLEPGANIVTEDSIVKFKYLDIIKPTSTVTIPVKVTVVGDVDLQSSTGAFLDGDTITGGDTGLTGLVYRYSTTPNSLKVGIAGIDNSATTFRITSNTLVAANDLLFFNDTPELVTVSSITGYSPTVTRASIGTTAASHIAGTPLRVIRPSATTTTLSAAVADGTTTTFSVTSSTGLIIGNFVRIGNELALIGSINGNNLTVTRGQLGTTATAHSGGATVTYHTSEGYVSFNYFKGGETISAGSITGVVATYNENTNEYQGDEVFVYDLDNDTKFSYPSSITYNVDRTYRFTQVDVSNTGHPLRFAITSDAVTDYSTGVTINGTPGSAGAYTEIAITSLTSSTLFTKCTAHLGEGISGNVNTNPLYTEVLVYDVDGTFTPSTSSFDTGSGANTVTAITTGPYGYVHSASGATVKVSLGLNSIAFTNAYTLYDCPRTVGAARTPVTISSVTTATAVNNEDFVVYDTAVTANDTTQITATVVGPGQSLIVYASAANINFVLNGFEDTTSDFNVVHYIRTTSGGGGGGGIIAP